MYFLIFITYFVGNAFSMTIFDQRQNGDLNVQLELKDLEIIAIMNGGKEEYTDYDYVYDYSAMTIKPQNGVTQKPLSGTSSTAASSQLDTSPSQHTTTNVTPESSSQSTISSHNTNTYGTLDSSQQSSGHHTTMSVRPASSQLDLSPTQHTTTNVSSAQLDILPIQHTTANVMPDSSQQNTISNHHTTRSLEPESSQQNTIQTTRRVTLESLQQSKLSSQYITGWITPAPSSSRLDTSTQHTIIKSEYSQQNTISSKYLNEENVTITPVENLQSIPISSTILNSTGIVKNTQRVNRTESLDTYFNTTTNPLSPPQAKVYECRKGFILNNKKECVFNLHGSENGLQKLVRLSQEMKSRREVSNLALSRLD